MEISAKSGSRAYIGLLNALLAAGEPVTAHGTSTVECRDVTILITDPLEVNVLRTERRPSAAIAATEALHLIAGTSSLAQLDQASGGRFSQFADGGRLRGAYGPRAYHRLEEIATLLSADPGTRQAVASIWSGQEYHTQHDVPCTLSYQFMIRGDRLLLRTSMRSNDVWLGLPYDLEVASVLQRTMALALGIQPGQYTHTVASMHLYDRDTDHARRVADAGNIALSDPNRAAAPAFQANFPLGDLTATHRWRHTRFHAQSLVTRSLHDASALNGWYHGHVPVLSQARGGWQVCPGCRYVISQVCGECVQRVS